MCGRYGLWAQPADLEQRFDSTIDDYSSIRNPTLCTDGGQQEEVERPGFVYIKFRIDMGDADDHQWSDVL